jgi:hypothetical protein
MTSKKSILYFAGPGDHTEETLRASKDRADELGIRDIVVASTEGTTGLKAVEFFSGYNVVVVTHVTGYMGPSQQEVNEKIAKKIRKGGGKIPDDSSCFLWD